MLLTSFTQRGETGLSDESLDERERRVGDLPPAAVDRERVSAVRDLYDLGHALVAPLLLEGSVRDGPWDGVVLLAGDDQQRSTVGVLGGHLCFGPGIQVGGGRLEEWHTGCRHGEGLVQLLRFLLADGVGEPEAELLVGERDRAVAVGGVAEDRPRRRPGGGREGEPAR